MSRTVSIPAVMHAIAVAIAQGCVWTQPRDTKRAWRPGAAEADR